MAMDFGEKPSLWRKTVRSVILRLRGQEQHKVMYNLFFIITICKRRGFYMYRNTILHNAGCLRDAATPEGSIEADVRVLGAERHWRNVATSRNDKVLYFCEADDNPTLYIYLT